jgi:hypothetical protein
VGDAGAALFIKNDLGDAVSVAQVNKRERAVIAPTAHPSHQRHDLSDVERAQRAAVQRPLQASKMIQHTIPFLP